MSEFPSEKSKMSAVAEMAMLCREAADSRAPAGNWKQRVSAVARTFGVGWSRAKDFYYATARRVDAEEMDRARAAIRELRARRQATELRTSFRVVANRLRQIDPDFYGDTIAALERVALPAGDVRRAGDHGAG